jgi:hypothetical protein
MSTRPPAVTTYELIATVAALTTEVRTLNGTVASLQQTVSGHNQQISDWKRDGKWLGAALTGLGVLLGGVVSVAWDWLGSLR